MKIQWTAFIVMALLLLAGKIFLFSHLEVGGSRPDLLLILAVHVSLHAAAAEALIASWLLGMLLDISSCSYFGIFSIFYLIISFFTLKIKEEIFVDKAVMSIIFVFFISLQFNLFLALFIFVRYGANLFLNSLLCAFYTTLIAPLLILLLFNKLSLISPDQK